MHGRFSFDLLKQCLNLGKYNSSKIDHETQMLCITLV